MVWIRWVVVSVLVVFGASAWAVCLRERYNFLVGIAWGAIVSFLIVLVQPNVHNRIEHWIVTMVILLLGGLLLRVLKVF
jgi:hypothetical protein